MSEHVKEKLVEDVQDVIDDAEAFLQAGAAGEERDRMADKLAKARERLKQIEHLVREKAIEGAKHTDRVIRDHPYESIGIAFGVGLLLGILVNRK